MYEKIEYIGNLFQVIRRKERFEIPMNGKKKSIDLEYEIAKRPPGVRAIIIQDRKVLLNKEFRYELNEWDYRLPGGKVFDSQKQADRVKGRKELMDCVEDALRQEIWEEADLKIDNFSLYECSHDGFTVEWDLYYYIVDEFRNCENEIGCIKKKSEFEYIQSCWVDYQTALQYCLDKKMTEERSIGVLLRFLLSQMDSKELEYVFGRKK